MHNPIRIKPTPKEFIDLEVDWKRIIPEPDNVINIGKGKTIPYNPSSYNGHSGWVNTVSQLYSWDAADNREKRYPTTVFTGPILDPRPYFDDDLAEDGFGRWYKPAIIPEPEQTYDKPGTTFTLLGYGNVLSESAEKEDEKANKQPSSGDEQWNPIDGKTYVKIDIAGGKLTYTSSCKNMKEEEKKDDAYVIRVSPFQYVGPTQDKPDIIPEPEKPYDKTKESENASEPKFYAYSFPKD